jgi:hypothetical protein
LFEPLLERAFAGAWPARLWGALPWSQRVDLVRHELAVLPAGSRPLRLAFLSDIHVGPTTAERTLDRAFELASAAEPDVLALGGDYLFGAATDGKLGELERRVAGVPASHKVAVLGNHDLWTSWRRVEATLERAGVSVLNNTALALGAPHDGVAVLGIDDPTFGRPDEDAALAACGSASVRIGLCHSPDGTPRFEQRGVALLLCGHTHGGHLATPWGPPYVPGRLGRRYPHGLHDVGGMRLFVSRGIGGVSIPARSWARPDVAVFDLVAG